MSKVHPATGDEENGDTGNENPSFNNDGDEKDQQIIGDGNTKKALPENNSTVVDMDLGSDEKGKEPGVDGLPEVAVFGAHGDAAHAGPAEKPYAGMGKEDLLRFSETDFWNRFRLVSILLYWAAWLALLGAVIGLTIVAPRCGEQPSPAWWQKSVVYQIYVRSFYDNSTDDGIGDIQGITEKLSYLKDLDVDAILLSSIFESNHTQGADYGYEITNYLGIDPTYGNLHDFEALIKAAHDAGIKVLVDFVPNYSGLGHQWFIDSQNPPSNTDPKWNYYVKAACSIGGGTTPNNWLSVYNSPAWTAEATGPQCYLHQFLPHQPELNLRSQAVQHELEEILLFWLRHGVDGFRVVHTAYLFESADFQDETVNTTCSPTNSYNCLSHEYTRALPESYDIVRRWRRLIDDFTRHNQTEHPRVLLTDADIGTAKATQYYGDQYGASGSHLAINYGLANLLNSTSAEPLTGYRLDSLVREWLTWMPSNATANWLTGDQDRSRLHTYNHIFNLLKLTLPGTAFLYYGEEIGMTNADVSSSPEQDPTGQARYKYRTPMQWNSTDWVDFTSPSTDPWLPVGNRSINVADQNGVDGSTLTLVKSLIKLRRNQGSLQYGATHLIKADENLFSFVREHEGNKRVLVAVNVGAASTGDTDLTSQQVFSVSKEGEVVFVTHPSTMAYKLEDKIDLRKLKLEPGQGVVVTWSYKRPFP